MILFDGFIRVLFGYLFLEGQESDHDELLLEQERDWDINGLCAGAHRRGMVLATGRGDGLVNIKIELFDRAPALQMNWEEIVETSFEFEDSELVLTARAGEHPVDMPANAEFALTLPSSGSYRVRYSAFGMDAACSDQNALPPEVASTDRYLVQLWPSPMYRDEIILETSVIAQDANEAARRLFPAAKFSRMDDPLA